MRSGPEILILGASKNVGRHLLARLGARALGTVNKSVLPGAMPFDALNMDIAGILDDYPSLTKAVILYGETDPEVCATDPEGTEALNVRSIKRVVDTLAARGHYIIFMSSQFVFDGTKGDYTEQDEPNPILLYGLQKMKVERYLAQTCDHYAVLRLSKAVGDEPRDGTLFPNWVEDILSGRRVIRVATDQILSPIYTPDVVEGLVRTLDLELQGVYHLAGARSYARNELSELLLAELGRRADFALEVIPCSIQDFPVREPRPLDVSLRPDKLVAASGLALTSMDEVCQRTAAAYFP
jgi:dTDP-4-dehydrorhamnose reductase